MKKVAKNTFRVFLLIIAALVVGGGIAFWQLSRGPVEVAFLTPYIEKAFLTENFDVKVGSAIISLNEDKYRVDLEAVDVRVFDEGGERLLNFPSLGVSLSLSALIQGTFAPRSLVVENAYLKIFRDKEGAFHFGKPLPTVPVQSTVDPPQPVGIPTDVVDALISDLLADASPDKPLSYLRRIEITDGYIAVEDNSLGVTWFANPLDLVLRRAQQNLSGSGDMVLNFGAERFAAELTILYEPSAGEITSELALHSFNPKILADTFSQFAYLQGVDVPLSLNIKSHLSDSGEVSGIDLSFTGVGGEIYHPDIFDEPIGVSSLEGSGSYRRNPFTFQIDRMEMNIQNSYGLGASVDNTSQFVVEAAVSENDNAIDGALSLAIDQLHIADLKRIWPKSLGAGGREWILQNVLAGEVGSFLTTLDLSFAANKQGQPIFSTASVDNVDGSFEYHSVEVDYLNPLPTAVIKSGTSKIHHDSIEFFIDSAEVDSLAVEQGYTKIYGLDGLEHRLALEIEAKGNLRDTLVLLDHPRLSLISALGLDPQQAEGSVHADITFDFPLVSTLSFDDISLTTKARVQNTALSNVVNEWDLSNGQLSLDLTEKGMKIAGDAELEAIPMAFSWSEQFQDQGGPQTDIQGSIPAMTHEDIGRLGFEVTPYVNGDISLVYNYRSSSSKTGELDLTFDALMARLSIPDLKWEKAKGVPGEIETTLILEAGAVKEATSMRIAAGSLLAEGRIAFDENAESITADISPLSFGQTQLKKVSVRSASNGVSVHLQNGVIDLQPFLNEDTDGSQDQSQGQQKPEAGIGTEQRQTKGREFEPFSLKLEGISRLLTGDKRYLQNVSLDMKRGKHGWSRLVAHATIPPHLVSQKNRPQQGDTQSAEVTPTVDKNFIAINFGQNQNGLYEFVMVSDDFGGMLKALDWTGDIDGGSLKVSGATAAPYPRAQANMKISADDFTVINAPFLAKLLTIASFTGILEVLSGSGIAFNELTGEFSLQDGIMRTQRIHAYGPSLGITAAGTLDIDTMLGNFDGTVVPAYALNRILGSIPLLGYILTGGEGGGLVAVNYSMKGPINDPNVSVNPLSALTPGFLRNLFNLPGDSAADEPPAQSSARPTGQSPQTSPQAPQQAPIPQAPIPQAPAPQTPDTSLSQPYSDPGRK